MGGEEIPYINSWVHLIWSTKNRRPVLLKEIRMKLFPHMHRKALSAGIHLHKINGIEDHIHALISLKPNPNISQIVKLLKRESSYWINRKQLLRDRFEWQREYIAISVSHFMVRRVRDYIKNQENHHRKKSFYREYQRFLKKSVS